MNSFGIFKILQAFLLPTLFIFVFLFTGFFLLLWKKGRKKGKKLVFLGLLFYYLFSITPVADLALKPLEQSYQELKEDQLNQANKVVLLLGGKESDILRSSEVLRIAHRRSGDIQIIVSGTDPLNPKSEEAEATRKFFINRGISPDSIIIEGKSRNTRESVKNVKELVGEDSFFLVTSGYHMTRSLRTFKSAATFPIPAPTDFKIKGLYNVLDFFPNAENLKKSDLAFHEYFGIVFYRFLDF